MEKGFAPRLNQHFTWCYEAQHSSQSVMALPNCSCIWVRPSLSYSIASSGTSSSAKSHHTTRKFSLQCSSLWFLVSLPYQLLGHLWISSKRQPIPYWCAIAYKSTWTKRNHNVHSLWENSSVNMSLPRRFWEISKNEQQHVHDFFGLSYHLSNIWSNMIRVNNYWINIKQMLTRRQLACLFRLILPST